MWTQDIDGIKNKLQNDTALKNKLLTFAFSRSVPNDDVKFNYCCRFQHRLNINIRTFHSI